MQSDRLIYNKILAIPARMFHFHERLGHLAAFFALFFISSVFIDPNLGMAQNNQEQNYQYQTPLFESLDDREVGKANLQSEGTAMILQNATIAQPPSASSDAQKVLAAQVVSTSNSTQAFDDSKNTESFEPSFSSDSIMLDDVLFKHYRNDVNGITVHYVMGGKGDAVVLLHGWPQTWYEWRDVMPILAKNNYTVIVPDLRGLGDSSKPATGFDGNTTASDIYQLVSDLGFNTTHLIGHDIGAQTGYSYATAHPNNVSKLVVIDYVFPGLLSNVSFAEPWWFSFHRVLDLPEALVAGNERGYLSWFYRQLAYNPYSVSEEAIEEYVRQYSAPGGMRSGFEYFRASANDATMNNETSRVKLAMPILAVSGEVSPFGGGDAKPNYSLESAKKLANNVSEIIMPFSGHWIPEEQPGPLANLLVKFFSDQSQQSSSNETGTRTSQAIEDLIKTIDNDSLIASNTSHADNLSNVVSTEQTTPILSANLSTGPAQDTPVQTSVPLAGPVTDETLSNMSISRNVSSDQRTSVNTTGEQTDGQLADQLTVLGNGSSNESARNMEGQVSQNQSEDSVEGQESIANQGTPLSEAIEAISKLFESKNGG
jgi:pimeloyl-ACP methyl ester carboxylesterase